MQNPHFTPSVRGLDARCQFALAKVIGFIHGVGSLQYSGLLFDSLIAAQNQGAEDFCAGIPDIPPIFRGEIGLIGAWKDGFTHAYKTRRLASVGGEHATK
jgi:hypothetical protein